MESYLEFQINCTGEVKDLLMAELAELDFDGFIETETGFSAYISQSKFRSENFDEILSRYSVNPESVPRNTIADQNWNAQWEASYEPIVIGNDIIVKAPFHLTEISYRYEIIIQPKNTFGTGHHETTQLMLEMMLEADFKNKSVFDYGCGTGVLGIFASKLGAKEIFCIDIDEWSAENVLENCTLNNIQNLSFKRGNLNIVADVKYDVIVANINKNILLESFERLSHLISKESVLIISGFYETDLNDLQVAAEKFGFKYSNHTTRNEWCVVEFIFGG